MNYDTIIVEMLSRIQVLESQVKEMTELIDRLSGCQVDFGVKFDANKKKVTTAAIRDYIEQLKRNAISSGEKHLTITANDIHKAMQLKSRFPMVCNAMRQCMTDKDNVVHDTPSGYSSTLEIDYQLTDD